MANEINASVRITCTPSNRKPLTLDGVGQQVSMAGTKRICAEQSIGTSAEALDTGEIVDMGWAYFHNLDATNYLKIRNGSSGADLIRLLPGEACLIRLEKTSVPYAIANTAACLLEYLICEY